MEYELPITVDASKVSLGIAEIFNSVNSSMSSCGCEGVELSARIEMFGLTMKTPKRLTKEQEDLVMRTVQEDFRDRFPEYDCRCDEIRCKSGKSSSQPQSR